MGRSLVERVKALGVAFAVPGVILAAASALALTAAVFGAHPMWHQGALNLSEAAAARDEAEIVRLIAAGEDPNLRRDVRGGIIDDDPVRLTPLEAAVAQSDASVIYGLFTHGAVLDGESWNLLRCLARGDDVRGALDMYRPAGIELRCAGVEPPW